MTFGLTTDNLLALLVLYFWGGALWRAMTAFLAHLDRLDVDERETIMIAIGRRSMTGLEIVKATGLRRRTVARHLRWLRSYDKLTTRGLGRPFQCLHSVHRVPA
jgi:hypothetical protein